LHQDAVDVEGERGVERQRRQLARGVELEAAGWPAQELVDALGRLALERAFELRVGAVVELDQLLADRLRRSGLTVATAALEEQIEIAASERALVDEIAPDEKLVTEVVGQHQLDLALLEIHVDALLEIARALRHARDRQHAPLALLLQEREHL